MTHTVFQPVSMNTANGSNSLVIANKYHRYILREQQLNSVQAQLINTVFMGKEHDMLMTVASVQMAGLKLKHCCSL